MCLTWLSVIGGSITGYIQAPNVLEFEYFILNLHGHDLAVAHRGAGLVCYSVTYLEYKSTCPAAYAIPLSHISDIRESARNFLESDRELYFKCPINIHGKLDAPSLIKYKVTPGGVI